jgi:adenylate kinase family enzyme
VIGSGGAGKSYLARELGRRLRLPVVHLDPLFWGPGWVPTPEQEWRAVQAELVRQPSWIIDGNHGPTLDVRLPAADTVVLLDAGRLLCMWRVVVRSLRHRRRPRPDRAAGCRERLDRAFLRWVWTFPRQGRPQVLAAIEEHAASARVIVLRRRSEVASFLASCGAPAPAPAVSPPTG